MANYGWITDPHFDHVGRRDPTRADTLVKAFLESVEAEKFAGVFITGDIATSYGIRKYLRLIEQIVTCPVFFVLGNHDFWGSSTKKVRHGVTEVASKSTILHYLSTEGHYNLFENPDTAILGHDGWYDGLNGAGIASKFFMNDWRVMEDYRFDPSSPLPFHEQILKVSKDLTIEALVHIGNNAYKAIESGATRIVILTHVPPFEEAHVHEGKPGDANAAPWFTSKLMGLLLKTLANQFPKVTFEVFCGHTHERTVTSIKPNLICHVGGSQDERIVPVYGNPTFTRITL